MSEVLTPVLFQLAIGGIGGFFIGYAIKKVVKIAIILGVMVFSLMYLAYADVINVDYGGLAKAVSKSIKAINPALGLFSPLLSHLPFLGSFALGLIVGFKMG